MSHTFNYRSYKVKGDADSVRERLTDVLLEKGFVKTDVLQTSTFFRYPSLRFSSKRPLTCISRLSLKITEQNGNSLVKIGVTFTKIRYFTIFVMLFFFAVLPAVLGYMNYGISGLMPPPMALMGIPLGFMVQYHVRWRIFRTLKHLIKYS